MRVGHIKASRKLFDGDDLFYEKNRPRTRWEAWLELIEMATYRNGTPYSTAHGTDTLARGEFVASLRYLGGRWKWDKMKVARYLSVCEKARRIARQRDGEHGTVYLIVNYDTYQNGRDKSETAGETAGETETRQRRDKGEAVKQLSSESSKNTPPAADAAVCVLESGDFDAAWLAYPRRAGGNPRRSAEKAWNARIRANVRPTDILAGVQRYAAYCAADGISGTRFVMQAATFFGPDEHWTEPWDARSDARSDARPATAASIAAERGPDLSPDVLLAAFDDGGLGSFNCSRAEYYRRVDALAEKLGQPAEDFRGIVDVARPHDLPGTFRPDRVRTVAARLAAARQAVAA